MILTPNKRYVYTDLLSYCVYMYVISNCLCPIFKMRFIFNVRTVHGLAAYICTLCDGIQLTVLQSMHEAFIHAQLTVLHVQVLYVNGTYVRIYPYCLPTSVLLSC